MMIGEAVAQYLASGGKITEAPGFTGVKPLPERREIKRKAAKRNLDTEPSRQVRIDFIAHGAGYAHPMGLRNKKVAPLMPKPLKQRGPGGSLLYDKTEALEAIRKIRELRSSFKKDVDEAVYAYAKKKRDKKVLSQDWGELDNAAS